MKRSISGLLLFQIYVFGIMASMSCSKNDPEIVDNSTTPAAESSFYRYNMVPGSDPNNGLVAKQVINSTGDELFFYGSFDENGSPMAPKSIAIKKPSDNTLMNVLLDASFKPSMVYFSNVNGEKYDALWTYEWISESSFIFRKFTYDWNTNTDNLDYETLVNYTNGQYNLEDNFVRTNIVRFDVQSILQENASFKSSSSIWPTLGSVVATGLGIALVAAVGVYGAVAYGVGTGLAAAGILGGSLLISEANASTPPIENTDPNIPNNPNGSPNPNPVSTVDNPTNLLTTTTSDSTATTSTTFGTTGSTGGSGTTSTSSTTNTTIDSMITVSPGLHQQLRQDLFNDQNQ